MDTVNPVLAAAHHTLEDKVLERATGVDTHRIEQVDVLEFNRGHSDYTQKTRLRSQRFKHATAVKPVAVTNSMNAEYEVTDGNSPCSMGQRTTSITKRNGFSSNIQ